MFPSLLPQIWKCICSKEGGANTFGNIVYITIMNEHDIVTVGTSKYVIISYVTTETCKQSSCYFVSKQDFVFVMGVNHSAELLTHLDLTSYVFSNFITF